MNTYELTVILRAKENVESLKARTIEILTKHGAAVKSDDSWGVRKLSYMIDREKEGYYQFLIIESPAEAVTKVIADFRLISDILRFLFVKIDSVKTA